MDIQKNNTKILIVEDSDISATVMKRFLEKDGYIVTVAENGAEGLSIAQKQKPDIILSDIMMPVMDGFELCHKVKNDDLLKDTKIILLTQLSDPKDVIKGLHAQADSYVTKPVDNKYLLEKVETLLTGRTKSKSCETDEGLEVNIENKRYVINSSRQHILDLLLSTYENSVNQNYELIGTQKELKRLNNRLEINFERLRKAEEENFKTLVELVPDIIYKIDKDGNIIYLNSAIKKLGYMPEEIIGKHFSILIMPNDIDAISYESAVPRFKDHHVKDEEPPKLFDERRSSRRMTRNLQVKLVPKNCKEIKPGFIERIGKEVVTVEINSSGMYETNDADSDCNSYIGTVGVIRDITERKRAAEALILSEKMAAIGLLAAGTAHELNNPLMGVLNYIQYLKEEIDRKGSNFKVLEKAEKGVLKCAKIVSDLLTFSRKRGYDCSRINLNDLILDTLDIVDYHIKTNNIKVIKLLEWPIPDMWVAIDQIQQILVNIITNAIDAMADAEKKELVIKTQVFGDNVELVLKDTGCGISDENMLKIFDPFFTTKPLNKGTGLGLSVTKRIVDNHHGNIAIKSKIGEGAIFTINLPLEKKDVIIESNGEDTLCAEDVLEINDKSLTA